MRDYSDRVRLRYKLLSRAYDLTDIICFPVKARNPRRGLANHIANEHIAVLDVCFGTGMSGLAIAEKNKANRVVGVDLSEDMLRVARRKIARKQLTNVELHCMDAANMKFGNEFDVVTTSLSLHEMPRPVMDSIIAEMKRVLKDDGKLYIIEWDRPEDFMGKLRFTLFPYSCEPSGFKQFLRLDWAGYLKQFGLKLEWVEKYSVSKLICASVADKDNAHRVA